MAYIPSSSHRLQTRSNLVRAFDRPLTRGALISSSVLLFGAGKLLFLVSKLSHRDIQYLQRGSIAVVCIPVAPPPHPWMVVFSSRSTIPSAETAPLVITGVQITCLVVLFPLRATYTPAM